MLDSLPAALQPPVKYRKDYQPPDWLVPDVHLDFDLGAERTLVTATLSVTRHGEHDRPLILDGDELTPLSVTVDGTNAEWAVQSGDLHISLAGNAATIMVTVELCPQANTKLMGLYASSGMLCTQCEAEGFRRIIFFPDRPDILSRYAVRMSGSKADFPVLLSNGNLTACGDGPDGKHWAEWVDPFPKPSYLFALVAGQLAAHRDQFITMNGKTVDLAIWVDEADLAKTGHAMDALKTSMKWDEDVYGREYDLGIFNIVAVADFNFGAMENKSLNIFNSRYILADADTATDLDYDNILGIVAHEYFHNWSGNRVTCRDWFQLSLKEGFTVFRDQQFSADQGSAAVKRIEDVRMLRASQFQEDAGPLAHPIRPDSYMEIGNFYTATVYNKGAEVIRMLHSLLGTEKFREGSDLYFDRHDGQAATCEDFIKAMEDGSGEKLSQFRLWYSTAGTPKVAVAVTEDAEALTLTIDQVIPDTPGQTGAAPLAIPLSLAVFDQTTGQKLDDRLELLTQARQQVRISPKPAKAALSINRGFSAPIIVESQRDAEQLAFLAAHDDDPFGRYEAIQQLMVNTLVAKVTKGEADHGPVIKAVRNTLSSNALDPAFVAEAVLLPSEAFIGDQLLVVDPDAIHDAREGLRADLAKSLQGEWQAKYDLHGKEAYAYTPEAKGGRRMRNVALGYLSAASEQAADLANTQYHAADNMTDRLAALQSLINGETALRQPALAAFYDRYRDNAIVIDKWFSAQVMASRGDVIETAHKLQGHADFSLTNPNRVRALAGALSVNQHQFHRADGAGYRFLADIVIALDPINPQTSAKLLPPLGRWRRFDEGRASLMKAELARILAVPDLSKDVFEQASKSLV
jgi:aminopeptidase N